MAVLVNLVSIFLSFLITVSASDVFHVNSKMTFYPDKEATYFGYSVVLSDMGLHVGAPKAASRFVGGSRPGAVFKCPLSYLDSGNTTCYLIDRDLRMYYPTTLFKDDMWFGAQMAATSDNKLLVCAPRFSKPYQDKHLLAHGICFALGDIRVIDLNPLNDNSRQAIRTDGRRKEFGAYETHLNYYAYGQAGMSMAYTKDHHLIIGAPGVLQWTGTVVNYQHIPGSFRQTTFQLLNSTNPYYTRDLSPDEYFGYSVDSGVFEPSGRVLHVAGAPRSKRGYGQVLIFKPNRNENDPLDIKAKLRGPQLGGYFGATLCTLDLNGDGISDLLVGAPNYATKSDGEITYDQGAVFVYITRTGVSNIILEETGSVMGSGDSGARFGTAIADLGDIDGDGMTDVAIGAPWENDGSGVVYIYRGSTNGLKAKYYQRIYAEGAMGFGISIAKGYDVDRNKCNDLVIGAHDSGSVYMYRSIPTIQVISAIKVPEAKRLRQDASNFTALFCITVPPNKLWSNVEIKLKATVTVDPENRRAESKGDTEYVVTARPGVDTCDEQVISINDQSDMSKPILLKFDLKPVEELDTMVTFPRRGARLSETSALSSSFLIQLQSDCGEDLICTPWLEMTLEPLGSESSHVPGIESRVGAKIIVKNVEEPAYSVKLHVVLPCPPKRLDSSCSLQNFDLVCDLPAPLKRNKTAIWEIDLEYTWDGKASELMIAANLEDPFYQRQVSSGAKELLIKITPHSVLNYTGKTESNASVAVSRETFTKFGDVLFSHYYEITNYGPSDLYDLKIEFLLSEGVYPARTIEGATVENNTLSLDPLILKANSTTAYHIPLLFNLTQFGNLLEENEVLNVTSKMSYYVQYGSITENRTVEVATTLTLEQKTPIWPLVVAVVAGLLVLAAIIFALYKFGFFSRPKKEDLKQLLENSAEGMKESTPSLNLNPLEGNSSNDEALFDSEVE